MFNCSSDSTLISNRCLTCQKENSDCGPRSLLVPDCFPFSYCCYISPLARAWESPLLMSNYWRCSMGTCSLYKSASTHLLFFACTANTLVQATFFPFFFWYFCIFRHFYLVLLLLLLFWSHPFSTEQPEGSLQNVSRTMSFSHLITFSIVGMLNVCANYS